MTPKGITGESSQEKTSKNNKTNKSKNVVTSPSPVKSCDNKGDATASSKKSKNGKVDSVKTVEARGTKRKVEESQKTAKPNESKSTTVSKKKRSSENDSAKSKKGIGNKENERLDDDLTISEIIASAKLSSATTPQKLVKKDKLSSGKSEQSKIEKQKENSLGKNVKPQSSTSRQQAKVESEKPSSGKTKSAKSKLQNQNQKQKSHKPSSSNQNGVASKASGTPKKVDSPNNHKAIQSTSAASPARHSKEPSGRRLKIMRALGLVAPEGSPFQRER